MAELPSGTVTFLFTDLEGSTRLWEEYPEAMKGALACHDAILRDAVTVHAGQVVKTTGDGFHAAFSTAHDAVDAAVAAQVALGGEPWGVTGPLRVRMGLHAGEATERDGDWFGSDVNRAARVMAVAHGGQVLCTGVVGEQVRERVALVDLGEHRLRDLQSEVHLFQVEVPGAAGSFPPLRSLDAYRSNLPYELSSFVGREEELRAIADRMRSTRVVSIVGVGGVGKTRLALQVGSELLPHYPDGVWLCELAQVLDPDDLPDAVAAAVGYVPPQGVSVVEGLPRFLERKDLLLVLDNCEHLVGAVAAFVAATTAHAARVSVLATSREALGVRGEHISPLASLAVPVAADATSVLTSEAGALFVARACEARGELELDDTNARAVHDLSARLDGIPLAIELAAARTKMMTPSEILTRLDHQFRLLTGGRRTSMERHQTLRAAIDWSYDLLGDDEKALLTTLSVCVGGFDLDAAVAIAAGGGADEFEAFELLASLVAKSLVERSERNGVTRYRLLEMIRQYAAEQLTTTDAAETARDDHAAHYLMLAITLFGEASTPADYEALERLDTETPNIAAAGRWLLAGERIAELVKFFDDLPFLDPFALPVTTIDELGGIAVEVVERSDAPALPGYPAACYLAGVHEFWNGTNAEYRRLTELAQQSSGDETHFVTGMLLGTVAIFDGDLELAVASERRAVDRARHLGDLPALAWFLAQLANVESVHAPEQALPIAEEALAVARRTGGTVIQLVPLVAVVTASSDQDPSRALEAAEECIRIDRTQRQSCATTVRYLAASLRVTRGEIADGLTTWNAVLHSYHDNGERNLLTISLGALAAALARVDPERALEFAAIAESDAIAAYAAITTFPELVQLAQHQVAEVAAAHARAATMSYDDAIAFVFATIDQLIAEHGPPATAS